MEYKAVLVQIYPYLDLLWLPVAMLAVHRHQRLIVLAFMAACMVMMRLLVELVQSLGYPYGIVGLLDAPLLERGAAVYSLFYLLYLLIVRFSPSSYKVVLLAASITIFFAASVSAAIVMVL
ncbi:MAG: hypothetical protein LRZ85_04405 [Alphaproteobacteria bacterium]|nr:hypothetical protein [Alphaproteobacteria bacterium]MCD8520086.1 hypothetical protein [Alphaproteobacteria bacterium]MCD8525864.1 hypothetical protein [Alphaproteobacteria bacterium]MCD8570863.1 hypothetical protein [Alphaproteobacteria bacterium]